MRKTINCATVILFLVLIFGFATAFLLSPDHDFSEEENRSLRTLPDFSWHKLANGSYSEQINDYFADQFPLRDLFVGVKGFSEIALGKGENNGVLLGENGQLATRLFDVKDADGDTVSDFDGFDDEHIRLGADGVNRAAKNSAVPFHVLFTGRTIDITASSFAYSNDLGQELMQALDGYLDPSVSRIETVDLLRQKHEDGEYVYYKTDHHWTTRGAYYAYVEVMRSFGMEEAVLPESAFAIQTVSEDFYGTAWSAGGMKFVSPDSVEFWLLGNESEFSVVADGRELSDFYSREYLTKKDKYSAFLDGTHDVVTIIKKGATDRPTLLLLKDSFANALAPFLAQHFDLVLLNLSSVRADFTNVAKQVEAYDADRVLLVYTIENIACDNKLKRLR